MIRQSKPMLANFGRGLIVDILKDSNTEDGEQIKIANKWRFSL